MLLRRGCLLPALLGRAAPCAAQPTRSFAAVAAGSNNGTGDDDDVDPILGSGLGLRTGLSSSFQKSGSKPRSKKTFRGHLGQDAGAVPRESGDNDLTGRPVARISTAQLLVSQGTLEKALDAYTDMRPAYALTEGFKGAHLLLDRANNRMVSITLWDSNESLQENSSLKEYQDKAKVLASFFAAPPKADTWEVFDSNETAA